MTVKLINSEYFKVSDGKIGFLPTAEEIYSVVFEGIKELRGLKALDTDFTSNKIVFSNNPADPVLLLETINGSVLTIKCLLAVKLGEDLVKVPVINGENLDYIIHSETWIPLPQGIKEEIKSFLNKLGVEKLGVLTMLQYMKLLRATSDAFIIIDHTHKSLDAMSLSKGLQGEAPSTFIGKLYPYQLDGYRWLSFMRQCGVGCIIADEMGLGKTVQVICLILEQVEKKKIPNLIITPATLLENWRRELLRFGPNLKVFIHSGYRRTGFADVLKKSDVVIASFDTVVTDVSLFRSIEWNLVIIDEAQGIKTPTTKRAIQLKTIPRDHSIAVTGTPVENRLRDLWSITDFVFPMYLDTLEEFTKKFPDTPESASLLEPYISPIILRRRVAEVARDLPDRINIPIPILLDTASATAYESIRSRIMNESPSGAALAALTSLRMFCTHPWLVKEFKNISDASQCSPKFDRLLEIIEEIILSQEKVLIFTSYQESIDLLVKELRERFGVPVDFIDGRISVSDRQNIVDEFSAAPKSSILLLNPRAAGTGLNITAANHVIHYNLEWNPAIEDQASARAYRRGQTKPVTVHRLYYANTLEEVINERMERKREMAETAIVGTKGQEQEIEDLMSALRITPVKKND